MAQTGIYCSICHQLNCDCLNKYPPTVIDVPIRERKPHRCPICGGKGFVNGGFYNSTGEFSITNVATEPCRSCGGTGIIWG